jgi:hypothetical protein
LLKIPFLLEERKFPQRLLLRRQKEPDLKQKEPLKLLLRLVLLLPLLLRNLVTFSFFYQ